MAGIGFVLRRVVAEDTYTSLFRGYAAAAVITSGPWFMAVFTMALLGVVSTGFLPDEERTLFFAAVGYSFAFSLITTGPLQLAATRMVADLLYLGRAEGITPALVSLLVPVLPVQGASMALLFALSGVGVVYAMGVGAVYAAVSGIWLCMVFLTASRRYGAIVLSFAVGYAASLGGSYRLGYYRGPEGAVVGFALGQGLLLVLLVLHVVEDFGLPRSLGLTVYRYVARFPSLAAVGLLYNLGIWADNIVFWVSPEGMEVQGLVRSFPIYDTAKFVAFMTAAPAVALFMVQVETRFFVHYRAFYDRLVSKATRREVTAEKQAMGRAAASSFLALLRLQGVVVALGLAFAPLVVDALGLPRVDLFPLRLALVGVGLHVLMSTAVLLLLYFNMRGSAVVTLATLVVANVLFTLLTLRLGYQWYGYGFLAAEAVAMVVGITLLVDRYHRLEYLTFSRQPITEAERRRALLPVQEEGL